MSSLTLFLSITVLAASTCFAAQSSKRGWGDFWQGSAVGGALATAALGKKDLDKKAIYNNHYGGPPPFVSGQYRQVRATSQQKRLQKRIHWGHAAAGAATGALIAFGRDDEKVKSQEAKRSSKRGWGDFWQGSAVGGALAAAALGKKDLDKKAIYNNHYGGPPPFVSGQYRQVRAASQQKRLQKRIHWGHAAAGAATGALIALGRDDETVKSQEAKRASSSSPIRKRGWGDFWQGHAVGGALAAAALGKKDLDKKSGQYRQVRAASQQKRLQKRIHWGHAAAGAATGALIALGRDDETVKSQEAKRVVREPWLLNPGFPSTLNIRSPWKKVSESWDADHGFNG